MAKAATMTPAQRQDVQLTISLSDITILNEIKKAIMLFRGVEKVSSTVIKNKDITKSAGFVEAMEDKKHGRVYHAENVDDMFSQILG